MVVESTGAWDAAADRVLRQLARAAAAREGEDPSALHGELLQDMSVAVRRFRARAALRRRAELAVPAEHAAGAGPAAAMLLAAT
jgi:CHAD domain-containing protein